MSKVQSLSVLTLTCQKTDYFYNRRPTCFYFEDYYVCRGEMKAYSLIILFCCVCLYTTVDMPSLKRNVLDFGYEFNYKYEGMLSHSFDRFYEVTKFILSSIEDIKISPIMFDMECSYLHIKLDKNTNAVKNLPNIRNCCSNIISFIYYYKEEVDSYNNTVYNILMKEISSIGPTLKKSKREKRGIVTTLVTGFIGLAYEGISNYLHNKRQKALQKSFDAMERKVNLERNKVFHLENSMLMFGIYNAEKIEKLVNTLEQNAQ